MARNREILGIAAAGASSCLGGVSVVATRAVVGLLDPATLAALRYGIGAICLAAVLRLLRRPAPARSDLPAVILLGVLFFTAFPVLFNVSLSYTTAARGSLALSTLPFLTLLVAAALRAEKLAWRKVAGVALAIAGVATALGDRLAVGGTIAKGDLFMIATAGCGALYNVLSRPYLARIPALSYTTVGMTAGALAGIVWAGTAGDPARVVALPAWGWGVVVFLGVGGAALTFFLWSYGLEHTTPTRVATTVALNPVVSLVLGALVLDEPAPPRLALGIVAILAGIILVGSAPGTIRACANALRRRLHKRHRTRRDLRILARLDRATLEDNRATLEHAGFGRLFGDRKCARPYWWLARDD